MPSSISTGKIFTMMQQKNSLFAEYLSEHNADIGMLQRTPPKTPVPVNPPPEAMTGNKKQKSDERKPEIAEKIQRRASRDF